MDFGHRGLWSTMLSILGVILLYMAFTISTGIHVGEGMVVGILYLAAVISLLSAVAFGVKGVLEREESFLKYVGIVIIIVLIVTITIWPFILNFFTY